MLKAILFDLDGVIVDSYAATIAYFQKTLAHFGLPVPEARQFLPFMGLKAQDLLKNIAPNLSDEQFKQVFAYSKQMSIEAVPQVTLKPGAILVLEQLHKNYKLALITSRGKHTCGLLFQQYTLDQYFDTVVDREDVKKHKPDPEGLYKALRKLDIFADEVIYVGDMGEDALAAKNAKITCVIIGDGTQEGDYHIKNLQELPTFLEQYET